MRCSIPILTLLIGAASFLSGGPAQSEPLTRAAAPLVPFAAAGIVKIQLSAPAPFTSPEQSLPPNGDVRPQVTASETAPFRIITSKVDTHYYLKLVEGGTGRSVLTVFVRSGQLVNMRVPFGKYDLKIASGQKWYGYKHLFGPDTVYTKSDSTFAFRREGDKIKGFQIKLDDAEGNEPASPIKPKDF